MSKSKTRLPANSWDARATVVIPYLDTPDWLQLVTELWFRQDSRPFMLVIETAPRRSDSVYVLDKLTRQPLTEVARLGTGDLEHASDAICMAMDYAFSRCPTEFLIATHVDMIPKHRGVLDFMVSQCGPENPVVGWEMSPRGKGSRGVIDGTVSNGFPGHVCTIFHMPTMDRIGAGWSLRRSHHAFGTLRQADPEILGWPDTETCLGMIFEANGIKPKYLGRETNNENQETEHWIHARSRTGLGMTPRHWKGFEYATQLLAQWREEDEERIPGQVSDDYKVMSDESLVQTCAYRDLSSGSARCRLASILGDVDIEKCDVKMKTCLDCRKRSYPDLFTVNPTVAKVIFQASEQSSWSRKKYAGRMLEGDSLSP